MLEDQDGLLSWETSTLWQGLRSGEMSGVTSKDGEGLPHPPSLHICTFPQIPKPCWPPGAALCCSGSKECHWLQGREGEGHWLQEGKVREPQLFPFPLSSCSQGLHKWGQDRTGQRESTRAGEARLANTRFIGGSLTPSLPHSGILGDSFPLF